MIANKWSEAAAAGAEQANGDSGLRQRPAERVQTVEIITATNHADRFGDQSWNLVQTSLHTKA